MFDAARTLNAAFKPCNRAEGLFGDKLKCCAALANTNVCSYLQTISRPSSRNRIAGKVRKKTAEFSAMEYFYHFMGSHAAGFSLTQGRKFEVACR